MTATGTATVARCRRCGVFLPRTAKAAHGRCCRCLKLGSPYGDILIDDGPPPFGQD